MDMRARARLLLAALAASLALGGCGGSDGDVVDDQDTSQIGLFEMAVVRQVAGLPSAFLPPNGPPGCLTITPTPWQDSDGDGVPDDATFTFDADGCVYTYQGGGGTRWGVVRIIDHGVPFGFAAALTGRADASTSGNPARTATLTLDGTSTVSGTPSLAILEQQLDLQFSLTGEPPCSGTLQWTANYTPAAGQTLFLGIGASLPSGQLTVSGTLTWAQDGRTYSFAISTPEPLVMDSSCACPSPVSGEVRFHLTAGGPAGYMRLLIGGCCESIETDWVPQD